jgi:hypothetical protein
VGSVAAAAARSAERSGRRRRHMCLLSFGLAGLDSEKLKELEEEDCCPICIQEALPYGRQVVVCISKRCTSTYGYCIDSPPKAPTRTDGEPAAK